MLNPEKALRENCRVRPARPEPLCLLAFKVRNIVPRDTFGQDQAGVVSADGLPSREQAAEWWCDVKFDG